MPIYEYQCRECSHRLEKLQKMSDAPLTRCPECGEDALTKLVSAAGFRLKGGGWYETDFKKDGKRNLAGGDDSSSKAGNDSSDSGSRESGKDGAKKDSAQTSSQSSDKPSSQSSSQSSSRSSSQSSGKSSEGSGKSGKSSGDSAKSSAA